MPKIYKHYSHLNDERKFFLLQTSGSVLTKKVYRSQEADLNIYKLETETSGLIKDDNMLMTLMRNNKSFNLLTWIFYSMNKHRVFNMHYFEDFKKAVSEINNTKYNKLYVVPSMLFNFRNSINLKHYDTIFLTGEAISPSMEELILSKVKTDCTVCSMYGSTETGPVGRNILGKDKSIHLFPNTRLIKNINNFVQVESNRLCSYIESDEIIKVDSSLTLEDKCEYISETEMKYLGRSDSFCKINGMYVNLTDIKDAVKKRFNFTDVVTIKFQKNEFDKFALYIITDSKIEENKIIDFISDTYKSINFIPSKVIISNEYMLKTNNELTKIDLNSLRKLVEE